MSPVTNLLSPRKHLFEKYPNLKSEIGNAKTEFFLNVQFIPIWRVPLAQDAARDAMSLRRS